MHMDMTIGPLYPRPTLQAGKWNLRLTVVEFFNASFDHYFITYVAGEIAKLDDGTFKRWIAEGDGADIVVMCAPQ